jgi:hypothetical protein
VLGEFAIRKVRGQVEGLFGQASQRLEGKVELKILLLLWNSLHIQKAAKLVQRVSHTPHRISSTLNILHFHGAFIKTKKPTLDLVQVAHSCNPSSLP